LLESENRKRKAVQEEHVKIEQQVLDSTNENLSLKKANFEQTFKLSQMQAQQRQAERRVQLLNDKKRLLEKTLQNTHFQIQQEAARAKGDLDRAKTDCSMAQLQLTKTEKEF
jgi:hypothetical protein